mgnify:CR=1 FL=1
MKKLLASLLSTAMVFTLAGCGSSKDHLATIQDKGEITIGLEGDWQPFSYHNKDDKLMGVDVEVAKNIAKKLGVKANIVEGKWDGLLTGLSTGTYDLVINGVDITKERENKEYAYIILTFLFVQSRFRHSALQRKSRTIYMLKSISAVY